MECLVCLERFNINERRPKCLPCGHSLCDHCVQQLPDKLCPSCRAPYIRSKVRLPWNYSLLEIMDDSKANGSCRASTGAAGTEAAGAAGAAGGPAPRRHWWCWNCSCVASERCEEEHMLTSVKAALRRHVRRYQNESLAEDIAGYVEWMCGLVGDEDPEQVQRASEKEMVAALEFVSSLRKPQQRDSLDHLDCSVIVISP